MFVTLREIQHFTAIMDEAAGLKATGKFPKALLIMLNTLIDENGLRSWQIYTDNFGISARLRFGHGGSSEFVYAENASSPLNQKTTTHTKYSKKTPAQIRRDSTRKTLKAKRQRIENDSDIENERSLEHGDVSAHKFDTPIHVSCVPPAEDVLFLEPLTPIKLDLVTKEYDTHKMEAGEDLSVAYTNSIESETGVIKCPNCNENMLDWDHICHEKMQEKMQTTDQKSIDGTNDETENEGGRVESVPKLMKVNNGQSQYYTYCGLAEKRLAKGLRHSAVFYYRCMSCNAFLCANCYGAYFKWKNRNAPICCKNVKLSDVNYDKDLKPK